ncbi:MAG: hypothetical protein FD181_2717 [Prolixibacteraceae bacterium]|nr:MAG: hypothetical protein FD181_2717 [Prolixibacteraceae bacterium]
MKKFLLFFMTSALFSTVYAQNIQTHYDFGKDRGYVTTTVEMFKPDKIGNTFFFIDFDYGIPGHDFMGNAYFEIARVMAIKKSPFGIHGEYNGGFGKIPNVDGYFSVNNAWLGGVDYSWNAEDFSKGFSIKGLFKQIQDKQSSFQITGVWFVNFAKGKMSFTGFADFWKEDSDFNFDGTTDATFTFLSEPQLWYNINGHFALGSEVELSNNFAGMEGFNVMPTLGVKWTF